MITDTGFAIGGTYDDSGVNHRAFLWNPVGRVRIEGSPQPGSLRYSNAVTWDQDGRITDLGALVSQWSAAFSINDGGTVRGTKANADGTEMRAVVWSVG